MTTKPKPHRRRSQRQAGAGQDAEAAAPSTEGMAQGAEAPDAETRPQPNALQPITEQRTGSTSLEDIETEGLTSRQLRLAKRIAHKQGLSFTSEFDAVRQLRQRGCDPFARTATLHLVVSNGERRPVPADARRKSAQTRAQAASTGPEGTPNTAKPRGRFRFSTWFRSGAATSAEELQGLDSLSPAQRRAREIAQIQKDIQRRRRRKMAMLFARLSFFVLIPTALAGWYFYQIATPMYASKSEFLIIQSESQGGGGLGLLSGTQFATNADSIAVQGYLGSKDAMVRLDKDAGFKAHFVQPHIDIIQRLTPEASNEEAYQLYKKRVKIGYDPTEGVIRLEVAAADPQVAKQFSEQLIGYAEERVNGLSAQKRDDQMRDARTAFENAERERRLAQENLVRLQVEGATLDPEGVIASLRTQISNLEAQVTEKNIEIATLEANIRPNQALLNGAKTTLRILEDQLADLNAKMTNANEGDAGLAQLAVRIQMAQADLATRDLILQSALQQVEQTRMEANRQVRYLTTAVAPVASEEPAYPRAFENTILAFLIFGGAYLMISLTASILREQVAS